MRPVKSSGRSARAAAASTRPSNAGIGPNHTLPTSGTARYTGGLCVMDFLRIRTWMRIDDKAASQVAVEDAVRLARIEGLEGHARAAEKRLLPAPPAKKQRV